MSKAAAGAPRTGDRLKPLRAFCQVARLGSVSRAAEVLFLSQPAVTLQLQALEREVGEPLFERVGRRMSLSRAGDTLYALARPLVEGIDGLDAELHNRLQSLDGGELHMAAGSSTILYLLPPLVRAFRAAHPQVRLVLHDVTGKDGLALLRGGSVELVVGSVLDVPGDLGYAPVARFAPMLVTPAGHPLVAKASLRLEDLSPYGLVLPPRHFGTWQLVDRVFQDRRVPYTVAMEVGGWAVVKQCVAMGLGISIVSAICLGEADRDTLAARDLGEYFPSRSYGVLTRKGTGLSAPARAFAGLARPELFERRADQGAGAPER